MPKGSYSSTSEYEVLDLVNHKGVSWVAKQNVKGIEPSEANSAFWFKMAGHIVVNNLSTSAEGYVLDARQGKLLQDELEVERARINQFTNLAEGSTTGDAELIDARVGADGKTYANLGEANRTQFANLNSDLSELIELECTWIENVYIGDNGKNWEFTGDAMDYFASSKIDVHAFDKIKVTYFLRYAFYDKGFNAILVSEQVSTPVTEVINIPQDAYFFAYTKETKVNPRDYSLKGFVTKKQTYNSMVIEDLQSKFVETVNVFDKTKFTDGYRSTNGTIIHSEEVGGASTDFIKVSEGDIVRFTQFAIFSTSMKGAFYDVNFNFIGAVSTNFAPDLTVHDNKYISFTVPSGVHYAVLSFLKAKLDTVMLTINNEYPSEYVPHEYLRNDIVRERDSIVDAEIKEIKSNLENGGNHGYLLQCFRKIGVVGDSLASGEVCSNNSSSTNHDMYEHSWLQYMARYYGFEGINFTRGGLSTTTWLTSQHGLPLAQTDGNECQCYIIGLGANDMKYDITTHLGTSADVGTNADTFYGNYSRIISELKTIQPKAKIFLLTLSWLYTEYYSVYCSEINNAIRYIADNTENCYLIDLENDEFFHTAEFKANMRSGHYNAIGYNMIGMHLAERIGNYMYEHQDEFRQVEFIGTDWEWN